MSKRLSLAAALAVFLTVSGMSGFVAHLTLTKFQHSSVYASSNQFEGRESQSALGNPTPLAVNKVGPFVAQASFITLRAGSPKAPMIRHDTADALQHDALVAKEDVDLGEIFIDSVK